MLTLSQRVKIPQSMYELPTLPETVKRLYVDFETSSGDRRTDSLNPFINCEPIGFGVTWDDMQDVYFIPMSIGRAFLIGLMERTETWVNHNVKYDAHVYHNCVDKLPDNVKLCCTLTGAKIKNSDMMFSGGYGLDNLADKWLSTDIRMFEAALKPYLERNKDFAAIPLDILGEYGAHDVITNRRLDKLLTETIPEECYGVWETEQALTKVLFDVEQYGMHVDVKELKIEAFKAIHTLLSWEEKLAGIIGRPIRPHTNADCFEVLCNQFGLPVIEYTEAGAPAFGKTALYSYLGFPGAPKDVIELIMKYRKLHTILNFFMMPYQELQIDGVLHSNYNQCVRTGRMSCKWPNSQQLNKTAKALIHPRPGNAFLSVDLSQIEFRYIVHYIKDQAAIDAYNENPDTDFHQWVADMCGIKRRPAKTVNFMIAFGGGKGKTIKTLSLNEDVVAEINSHGPKNKTEFNAMCAEKGESIYNSYHMALPNIKPTAKKAGGVAYMRGYVKNWYGRHRHLPQSHAHIAFNTINQSSAADLMKERTVAVHEMLQGTPIKIVASVHDETLFEGPIEVMQDPRTQHDIASLIESPARPIRVPIRCAVGYSEKHWKEACSDEVAKPIEHLECHFLEHLK